MNIFPKKKYIGRLAGIAGILLVILTALPASRISAEDEAPILVRIETAGQSDSHTFGEYVKVFRLTRTERDTLLVAGTFKIFNFGYMDTPWLEQRVDFPSGSGQPPAVLDIDGLVPGTYVAEFYVEGALASNSVRFDIHDNGAADGISISYPPEDQVITKTSATIKGIVVTQIAMPVKLTFVSGRVGSPMGNEQPLLTLGNLEPNTPKAVTLTFTGLSEGQAYQFAIKNNISNKTSSPLQFTTKTDANDRVGLTYGGAIAPYIPRTGGNDAPPDITITDDISDKGIVPKCGRTQTTGGTPLPANEVEMCGFDDFLQLISNVLKYAIVIIGPIVACIILYSGAMIIWLGKDKDPSGWVKEKIKEHGARLVRVAIGVAIILLAWMIVATILRELGVKEAYSFLDIFS